MIEKKIKCTHCNTEIVVECTDVCVRKCNCGVVAVNNGIITEGSQGIDWVDISAKLLNE